MLALVDTNVLVYRFDPRDPAKQARARDLMRQGAADRTIRLPYQALVEFVSAVTRPQPGLGALLAPEEARLEAEDLLYQFRILYPSRVMFRTAIRGAAAYGLSWFDALIWSYAEHHGLGELWSEDFQHGRRYGAVRAVNPFVG